MSRPHTQAARTQVERLASTRAALLKAASTIFAEQGYASAATEEIVRRAKVTRGALYHHFEDKRALFDAVASDVAREIAEKIDAMRLTLIAVFFVRKRLLCWPARDALRLPQQEPKMDPYRFSYSPVVERPKLSWPNGARVAVWVCPNIEHYEYLPAEVRVRNPWPRMGSFIGAAVGGFIIGITEALGGLFLGEQLGQIGISLIFILILLFRPSGLFGAKR